MTALFWPDVDYVIIAGDKSPGVWRLTKADSPSGIDVRKGYGLSGASTVPTGEEPSDIEFEVDLWDETKHPDQWDAYARKWLTRPVYSPGVFLSQKALSALALPIIHPALNRAPINVTKVLRHNCTQIKNDGNGLWQATVSFLQFRLPRIALPKPTTSLPNKGTQRPTAQNANQKEIQALQATLNAEMGQ